MPTLTADVPEDFLRHLDEAAVKLNRPRAWVVRHAVQKYLEERTLQEQHWQETLEAIAAVNGGEVVPAEEISAWLDTWGQAGEVLEYPE